jgi:hypothetical protein
MRQRISIICTDNAAEKGPAYIDVASVQSNIEKLVKGSVEDITEALWGAKVSAEHGQQAQSGGRQAD